MNFTSQILLSLLSFILINDSKALKARIEKGLFKLEVIIICGSMRVVINLSFKTNYQGPERYVLSQLRVVKNPISTFNYKFHTTERFSRKLSHSCAG